jgi:hypothetical protein
MKDGELVELFAAWGDNVDVGGFVGVAVLGTFPDGTLAMVLGPHPFISRRSEPATMILIDGLRGWVWNDEIRPVSTSYSRGDQ